MELAKNGLHLLRLCELEKEMLNQEQVEIPVTHRFSGGVYNREIFIPKGTLLTSRVHKFDHFDVMLSGDISIATNGDDVERLKGQHVIASEVGKKRLGYAHEDTVWMTFHAAPELDDHEEMLDYITCETHAELELFYKALREITSNQLIETNQDEVSP
jgi:hypothetical protein